jgi:mannan endo-1,4-beta-mannosidase
MIASTGKLQNNDPDYWLCGRAGNMKNILGSSVGPPPHSSSSKLTTLQAVKVATGGIGGSDYCCDHEFNIIDKALYWSAIDIISVHGYMSTAAKWSYFIPKHSDVRSISPMG